MIPIDAGFGLLGRTIEFMRSILGTSHFCTAACAVALALPLAAADPVKLNFQVPAGEASKALKVFAEQAGREIIFATKPLRGLRTNAVQGSFTIRQALDRLLAGTDLSAIEDNRTGALVVQRRGERAPDESGSKGARKSPPAANHEQRDSLQKTRSRQRHTHNR